MGGSSLATRRRLAAKSFAHTWQYDAYISLWLAQRFALENEETPSLLPEAFAVDYPKAQPCRYGENPHQQAAFYIADNVTEPCVANAKQIHGKELSFNNIYDLNGALETVKEFSEEDRPAAVIIKHTNPCGAALGDTLADAFAKGAYGRPDFRLWRHSGRNAHPGRGDRRGHNRKKHILRGHHRARLRTRCHSLS